MLQLKTLVNVADNSGAEKLSVIQVYGKGNRKIAYLGDIVTGVVKKANSTASIKAHSLVKAIVVRCKKETRRSDGSYIRFDDNAVVLIDSPKDKNPIGSRIFGPVARELKDLGFNKIVSMAAEVY